MPKIKHYDTKKNICGCDEAGRGALAGPVVAAAVILPKVFWHDKINDSKKISQKNREILSDIIKKNSLAWGIGVVNMDTIDKINILNASIQAMHLAINMIEKKLKTKKIDILLIDGNRFRQYKKIEHKCIIKGDGKYLSIAAASILAKTYRDNLMKNLHKNTPIYNWSNNKGYPTKKHKEAIKNHGISKYHRKSFKLFEKQYILKF